MRVEVRATSGHLDSQDAFLEQVFAPHDMIDRVEEAHCREPAHLISRDVDRNRANDALDDRDTSKH